MTFFCNNPNIGLDWTRNHVSTKDKSVKVCFLFASRRTVRYMQACMNIYNSSSMKRGMVIKSVYTSSIANKINFLMFRLYQLTFGPFSPHVPFKRYKNLYVWRTRIGVHRSSPVSTQFARWVQMYICIHDANLCLQKHVIALPPPGANYSILRFCPLRYGRSPQNIA